MQLVWVHEELSSSRLKVATDVLYVVLNVDAVFTRPMQRHRSDSMLPSKGAAGLSSTLRGCMALFQIIWGLSCTL
jgi:hypothetical protein